MSDFIVLFLSIFNKIISFVSRGVILSDISFSIQLRKQYITDHLGFFNVFGHILQCSFIG